MNTLASKGLKIVFAVQGEGRGHLSQAIVAYEWLKEQGHTITGVVVGGTKSHSLPAYFKKRMQTPVYRIESPGFIRDKQNKAVRLMPTIISAISKIEKYRKSMLMIREIIKRQQPDLIINFYEPLIGMAHWLHYIHTYTISIAHQYLFLHPDFIFPSALSRKDKWMLKQYTKLTATGSRQLLALSFNNTNLNKKGIIVPCPPLLRNEIKSVEPFKGTYLLVYIVNAGYMENIIEWHKKNPDVTLHCFTDSNKVKDKWEYSDTLTFHCLNDQQFIRYMINAAAVVTTAGFESVCEAFYLNKPVMMVPVEGHAEQKCNAFDGEQAGVGIASSSFNLTKAIDMSASDEKKTEAFKDWVNQLPEFLQAAIIEVKNRIKVQPETEQEIFSESYSME
jgi:uncharacterized protein (TIGR00661 family)